MLKGLKSGKLLSGYRGVSCQVEVVNRGSETQIQVGGNYAWLISIIEDLICPDFINLNYLFQQLEKKLSGYYLICVNTKWPPLKLTRSHKTVNFCL